MPVPNAAGRQDRTLVPVKRDIGGPREGYSRTGLTFACTVSFLPKIESATVAIPRGKSQFLASLTLARAVSVEPP